MNERKPPLKWAEWKEKYHHSRWFYVLIIEWALEWVNHGFGRWAFVEFLEYVGKFTIVFVVVIWFMEADDRALERRARIKEMHHRAYSLIAAAAGQPGDIGRREALKDLNEWGQEIGDVNLEKANLSGIDLRGADLRGANLAYANLRNANLWGADLRESKLTGAVLYNTTLIGASLDEANLTDADLREATLTSASLWNTVFISANLESASLQDAYMVDANFENANLTAAPASAAKFTRANLRGANLTRAALYEANVTEANLWGANLTNAITTNTNFGVAATMYGARMDEELRKQIAKEYPHLFERPD